MHTHIPADLLANLANLVLANLASFPSDSLVRFYPIRRTLVPN